MKKFVEWVPPKVCVHGTWWYSTWDYTTAPRYPNISRRVSGFRILGFEFEETYYLDGENNRYSDLPERYGRNP